MAKHDLDLNQLFASLADPTRRAVVSRLARGPASVSELASSHDMALPSFLKHLGRLEEAGIIRTSKRGRVRSCELNGAALVPVRHWLDEQRALWEARLDRFDDYVTQLMKETDDGPEPEDRS